MKKGEKRSRKLQEGSDLRLQRQKTKRLFDISMTPNIILCLFFLTLLFGAAVISFVYPDKSYSEHERRYLETRPKLNVNTVISGAYEKSYETYLSDQFPGRDRWVTLKNTIERVLQKKEMNGVYFGKEDYLIEHHTEEAFPKEQRTKNLNTAAYFLKSLEPKLGQEHLKLMLVPTADNILSDKLPAGAPVYEQVQILDEARSVFDRLDLKEAVIDITKDLEQHKEEQIYYRTDHHWTTLGAYYGYREWAEAARQLPEPLDNFIQHEVTDSFYGTLYSKVNIKIKPDRILIFQSREDMENKTAYQVTYNLEAERYNTFYDFTRLAANDQYTLFLKGNQPIVKIERKPDIKTEVDCNQADGTKNKKLLIIKDSFANCFAPFAARHYDETHVVDLRYFRRNMTDYISENEITDILMLYNTVQFSQDKNLIFLK